jgi:hypothetical protein
MLVKMIVILSEKCRWVGCAGGVQILGLSGGMMERCVELVYFVVQVVASVVGSLDVPVVSFVVLRYGLLVSPSIPVADESY